MTGLFTMLILFVGFSMFLKWFTAYSKTAKFKGKVGELKLSLALKNGLNPSLYQIIENVTLTTNDGTTQIDHIVVSVFGVFAIETKNMSGWIFGSKNQREWTQKFPRHSTRFQNPLRQNYKHTKTLEALLNLTEEQIHSVIVFVGESEFKTEMPENVLQGVNAVVDFINAKNEKVLTNLRAELIGKRIQSRRLAPTSETEKCHIENLKKRFAELPELEPAVAE